jgi:glycerol-3-phosphate dehydrogenase
VNEVLTNQLGRNTAAALRLVKTSHIITRKLYPENYAFSLRTQDMRAIYVIPYERAFTLIGTAEMDYEGDPANATITEAETSYLCDAVNTYFDFAITPNDAIWTYSGVRALPANGHGYTLDLANDPGSPPLLSVYSGSINTYRKLAEQAMETIMPAIGRAAGKPWTATVSLPGGDTDDIAVYARMFRAFNTHLDGATARRLVYSYGTRVSEFVQPQMGHDFGNGLTRAEVDYLVRHEWARTAEDILWRRTKLGLHVQADTEQRLTAYLARDRS